MQLRFLSSDSEAGDEHFGIITIDSSFQMQGQILVLIALLKIAVNGIASRSEYVVTSSGKMSPGTIERGFLKVLILEATSYSCKTAASKSFSGGVISRGKYLAVISLKYFRSLRHLEIANVHQIVF